VTKRSGFRRRSVLPRIHNAGQPQSELSADQRFQWTEGVTTETSSITTRPAWQPLGDADGGHASCSAPSRRSRPLIQSCSIITRQFLSPYWHAELEPTLGETAAGFRACESPALSSVTSLKARWSGPQYCTLRTIGRPYWMLWRAYAKWVHSNRGCSRVRRVGRWIGSGLPMTKVPSAGK
jgi:hypothetical protein